MRTLLCSHVTYLFISILAALVYLPALGGDFVLDDGFNILQNHLLYVESLQFSSLVNAALSFHDGNGARPLPMLSFALDYWRAGSMDPGIFKATNLFIHAVTAFFLAFFLRRLLGLAGWTERQAMWGAGLLAFIWAVHPLQVSSVMYIVQRMQTMATLFVVLTLWAYLGMRQLQLSGQGRGRFQGILVLVFWCLALACKEDAVLVFAYALALELTVLRFRAVDPVASKGLKQSYLLLTTLGAMAYLFVVLPHFWSWDNYSTRDFSSLERLMTQSRVLMMYLGQILFPWPGNMTFLYDNYTVSHGLLSPWTTLPALMSIAALLIWAWRWRSVRPLFSFGVLLFFAGHFITSNVIALELVFEHRNHLPLLGIVVAVADLCRLGFQRCSARRRVMTSVLAVLVLMLVSITLFRAYIWGDPVRHGERMVSLMPESSRAWMQLSGVYFTKYNDTQNTEHLAQAVEVIDSGLRHVKSPTLASNLVVYKSLLGTATRSDWERFFDVLQSTPPSWHDKFAIWTQMNNVDRGFEMDVEGILEGIEIVTDKTGFSRRESLKVAVFIYKHGDPEDSLPHFLMFARKSGKNDAALISIISQLRREGRTEWADQLEKIRLLK